MKTPTPAQPAEQGEALHTPGPWEHQPASTGALGDSPDLILCHYLDPEGGWRRTDFLAVCDSTTQPNGENAKLMARAWEIPALESRLAEAQERESELLAALKEIEDIPAVAFTRNQLEMATRTIERMETIAREARLALLQRAKQALEVRG